MRYILIRKGYKKDPFCFMVTSNLCQAIDDQTEFQSTTLPEKQEGENQRYMNKFI